MKKYVLIIIVTLFLLISIWTLFRDIIKNSVQIIGIKTEPIDFPDNYIVGAYVWESPDELSSSKIDELLLFANEEKINTLYLNISRYLDIVEKNDTSIKTTEIINFENTTKLFIGEAKKKNISVQALSGGPMWSNSSHEYIPPLMLKYIFDFNKRNPDSQFSGFQFDIEYYNQGTYKNNKLEFSSNYLKLVDKLITLTEFYKFDTNKDFQLGFAIPFWLDNKNGNYIFEQLADKMDRSKNSYLAIMAYRNYQFGQDGTINIIENEINYIEKNTPNVSIIVVQETDKGESSKTTFYGKSRQDLKQGFRNIVNSYHNYKNFKGIAIHHLFSYQQLKKFW